MKKTNRLIMGSAFSLAAIAIAIDHTQHRLPEPVATTQEQVDMIDDEESPCGMGSMSSPCSMDGSVEDDSLEEEYESESPCSMDSDSSPCGMGD
jgi:hypothetical protein